MSRALEKIAFLPFGLLIDQWRWKVFAGEVKPDSSRGTVLQFQFHRALSRAAGCRAPLHRCSIYESREAGRRLNAMLSMGQSRPAILDYFAPLRQWLAEQTKGKAVGW
jgi:peptidyl-dipeptidase A